MKQEDVEEIQDLSTQAVVKRRTGVLVWEPSYRAIDRWMLWAYCERILDECCVQ